MPIVLVIAFVVVPVLEIWFLIQVGQVIGPWWTVGLLLLDSFVGAWLVRHEGRRAWAALRERIQGGRFPSRELADAALILVGGTLLLTPGFLTDVLGFALVLPLTRPLARRLLAWLVYRQAAAAARRSTDSASQRSRPPSSDRVVAGEVINDSAASGAGSSPGSGAGTSPGSPPRPPGNAAGNPAGAGGAGSERSASGGPFGGHNQ